MKKLISALMLLAVAAAFCGGCSDTAPVFDQQTGGQAAMYQYRGWKFIVLVNASPSTEVAPFGSEYIMFKAMAALGLTS